MTSAFAAWIGLVSYWWVARRLYLFSLATWMLLILLSGPSVMPSVAAVIAVMNALVGGIILGLVYFSDLAPRFERGSVERAAANNIIVLLTTELSAAVAEELSAVAGAQSLVPIPLETNRYGLSQGGLNNSRSEHRYSRCSAGWPSGDP